MQGAELLGQENICYWSFLWSSQEPLPLSAQCISSIIMMCFMWEAGEEEKEEKVWNVLYVVRCEERRGEVIKLFDAWEKSIMSKL